MNHRVSISAVLYSTMMNIKLQVLTSIREKRRARDEDTKNRYFTAVTTDQKLAVCSIMGDTPVNHVEPHTFLVMTNFDVTTRQDKAFVKTSAVKF